MYTPEQLGDKGEGRFSDLCVDANLVCNKSDRDRTGWDFIIEDSFKECRGDSLDKRKIPLSCHIQVKTVFGQIKPFKMKLNMAERLAKELKPAFICVFVVGENLQVIDSYLIHILNDRLASILKVLRKQSATNAAANSLNKVAISMTAHADERFNPTGEGLREAIAKSCGDHLFNYTKIKQEQIKRLGFKERPIKGKLSFRIKNETSLGDILLGLQKDVEVTRFMASETRFNIELPIHHAREGKVSFTPSPNDRCRVLVKDAGGARPVTLDGELFIVPGALTKGRDRYHVRTKFLTIDLFAGTAEVQAKIQPSDAMFQGSSKDWLDYWRVLEIYFGVSGAIEIRPHTSPGKRLEFPIARDEAVLPDFNLKRFQGLASAFDELRALHGEELGHQFAWDDLLRAEMHVALISEVVRTPDLEILIPIGHEVRLSTLPDSLRTVVCNRFDLGQQHLAYTLVAELIIRGGETEGKGLISKFELRHFGCLEKSQEAFEAYERDAKHAEKTEYACKLTANIGFNESP